MVSHFTTIKTSNVFTNKKLLSEALSELGYRNVSCVERPQALKDYYQVRGNKLQSQITANVIVPFASNRHKCKSDFGFAEENGELVLVADSMDRYRLNELLPKLQEVYNQKTVVAMKENILATAKTLNKGVPIIEEVISERGAIQLKIAYPADIRRHNQIQQQQIRR